MSAMVESHVDAALQVWQADGLLTSAQVAQLRDDLAAHDATTEQRRGHLAGWLVEGLGYLGGALVAVAVGLVVSSYWSNLADGWRAAILVGLCLALGGAGFAVPQRAGAGIRLRSVLWLASTGAAAASAAFILGELVDVSDRWIEVEVTGLTLVVAAGYWLLLRQPLQLAATLVLTLLTTGTLVGAVGPQPVPGPDEMLSSAPGFAVWAVALAWFALGVLGRVQPPKELVVALGGAGMILGALMALASSEHASGHLGAWLAVATLVGLLAVALLRRDFVPLVVMAVGTLMIVPQIIAMYFGGGLGAAVVLVIVGAALIGAAVAIARRRRPRATPAPPL
ncbi:MAG: DUF2157 domain-containing protein [Candidatus Nanopelagicales bacterium]